jgi:TDG/mug DNA glycosylase family protein
MPRSSPRTKRLPARLCPRPRILFVGINPSLRSAEVGHHFAGPGNPFWRLLHAAGLTPGAFTCEDDARLPSHGLALTNIVPRATRAASELTRAEFEAGRARLARLIARVKPRTVAFVGVTVYRAFFGPRVSPGPGPKPQRIGEARVFVLPNPSGLNAAYPGFRDKLVWFERLRRYAEPRRPDRPRRPGASGRPSPQGPRSRSASARSRAKSPGTRISRPTTPGL